MKTIYPDILIGVKGPIITMESYLRIRLNDTYYLRRFYKSEISNNEDKRDAELKLFILHFNKDIYKTYICIKYNESHFLKNTYQELGLILDTDQRSEFERLKEV